MQIKSEYIFVDSLAFKIIVEKDKEYYDDKGIRQESHISIFLCICASPVLNLDLPAKIDYIFELIHPSDADKNLKRAGT